MITEAHHDSMVDLRSVAVMQSILTDTTWRRSSVAMVAKCETTGWLCAIRVNGLWEDTRHAVRAALSVIAGLVLSSNREKWMWDVAAVERRWWHQTAPIGPDDVTHQVSCGRRSARRRLCSLKSRWPLSISAVSWLADRPHHLASAPVDLDLLCLNFPVHFRSVEFTLHCAACYAQLMHLQYDYVTLRWSLSGLWLKNQTKLTSCRHNKPSSTFSRWRHLWLAEWCDLTGVDDCEPSVVTNKHSRPITIARRGRVGLAGNLCIRPVHC